MNNKDDEQGNYGEAVEIELVPKLKSKGRPKGVKDSKKVIEHRKTAKILELNQKNIPTAAIARVVCMNESTVKYTIKKYSKVFKELENVQDYRNIKTDIIDAAQLAVLKSGLTDKKLEKASLISSMQAFEILNKAGRLERGLSTENQAVSQFVRVHLTGLPDPEKV